MSFYFFDSSGLVKGYVNETGTLWVRSVLKLVANEIFVARIAQVEVAAAIARRVRTGTLSRPDAKRAKREFEMDLQTRLRSVSLSKMLASASARLAIKYVLRAYDAVQLASALRVNAYSQRTHSNRITLVSSDRELLVAAVAEGLAIEDPLNHP